MVSFLVYYGTGVGQTATIADRIVGVLTDRGHDATGVNAVEKPADLTVEEYDSVLVGASIHGGKHQQAVTDFVTANRDALSGRPTAFFQVSMSAATEEGKEQAAGYVEAFLDETEWHPDRIAQFGGALRFSGFGFLKRFVVKQVVKREMPGLDTSKDAEFTDWQAVEDFANDVAAFVEGRLGVPVPAANAGVGNAE
ncbi:protoporphyrinogen oxidase [Halostella sp. JP-L12]|uniref:flavodoxin domain-containing protein n=1 Tax=Halostella TaxID=1843185 RepID=UPI000EF7ADBC|nr:MULTISPECIES: flavodoxin domain-containing protein [Halostella]NHN49376.1 protoporphyrinogen oxidase [Halostella sp. JP-L12]